MSVTRLDLFIRATDALVKFDASFSAQRDEELDIYILELQEAEVKRLWDRVKTTFEDCLNFFKEDDSSGNDVTAVDGKYEEVRSTSGSAQVISSNIFPSREYSETSSGLKKLQRGINGCISAMSNYDVSTEDWDPILVFICLQRLPKNSVTLWEQSVKDKSALSSWEDLDAFLTERIQTLACLRDIRGIDTGKPSTINHCSSPYTCSKCNKRHHTLLHRDNTTAGTSSTATSNNRSVASSDQPSTSTGIRSDSSSSANRQVFHTAQSRNVLLGTAMVNIVHHGTTYPARALIDPASEASFITERLQRLIGITATTTLASISGINQTVSTTSRKLCSVSITSPLDASRSINTTALILPSISGNLPSFTVNADIVSQLPNLRLADPNLFKCRPVDLLLGADLYPKILQQGTHINILGSLIAQNTVFGWIITGPIPPPNIPVFSTKVSFSEEENLDKTLLRFWELEEIPKRKILSPSDQLCEDYYKRTTRRDSNGRYVVSLPLKTEIVGQVELGFSRANCLRQFLRNEASLLRKPQVKVVYDQVVNEYLALDHMRPVGAASTNTSVCYLPHHPVINPDKQTTKLRVVFNASNKTSNGKSLNDILHVGPTLQLDLVLLILRWRLFKFVFNCDITQMYRQIRVDPAHTPLQRIVFRDSPQKPVQDFELQTVTFGVNCAPYLAIRTLLQLADDTNDRYPLAAHILRRCMYVDDVLTGYHDICTALDSRDQLIAALSSAKFELRKWTANDRAILQNLPTEDLIDAKVLSFIEASSSKPLGIRWNAQLDLFYFSVG
ncbi:uncharacterized protein [Musca autumnalis]|uniref:uncharacterized protein n=1 Tax=Musca autumnalis TaxID=221902 RepID=UPI003CFA7110